MSDLNKSRIKFFGAIALIIVFIFIIRAIINRNPNIDKDNYFYVNSIYLSDGMFYNRLDDRERIIYDNLMDGIKKGKKWVMLYANDYDCKDYKELGKITENVVESIWLDHPELLSFGEYYYRYDTKENGIKVKVKNSFKSNFMTFIGEMVINFKVKRILKKTEGMTDAEKVKYVYEWIGKTAKYNTSYTWAANNQTIYSVFINHNSVCAGFAKTAQVIFQRMGIKSYLVLGYTTGYHMWNIVEIDGKYYYFDSTIAACYDEKSPSYYNGINNKYLLGHNRNDHPDWYPELETTNFSY